MSNISVRFIYGYPMSSATLSDWYRRPDPDSGYCGVRFSIKNNSNKTFKYAHIEFIPYNRVHDIAQHCSESVMSVTGPLAPQKSTVLIKNDHLWKSTDISYVSISKVLIEYMDGTQEIIMGRDIDDKVGTPSCYIATAVYGSYDCPQVWTLRRFRDYTLAETWYGRAFIRTYYAISPTLVKWFGKTEWFQRIWRNRLDHMVANLQAKGVEDTPYNDRNW